MVCVILQVITHEAKVDWSQLAMLMTFMMLGIALSLTGVIADIMAHIFIRLDNHFTEGDYIVWEEDLVQIGRLEWRHTIGVSDSTNAYVYIPNKGDGACRWSGSTSRSRRGMSSCSRRKKRTGQRR